MPIVPFTPVPPQRHEPEITPSQEPWMLMAAAQMDAQGRLLHDRKDTPVEDTPTDG